MGNDILKKLKKFFEFVNGFSALRRVRSERHSANTQNMGQEAQKMKKILVGALTAAVVLTAGGAVWAAGGRGTGWRYVNANGDGVCDNQGTGYCWVDENNDGICDNQGAGCRWVDADGDGICDNQGTGWRYVDENGDGICDNQGAGRGRMGRWSQGGRSL